MAIYLITGTPGAGKTLNTIREVHQRAEKEGRVVYYANIVLTPANTDLNFANWIPMADQESADLEVDVTPHSWYNAPDGAILLIDECQDFYPAMSPSATQPDYIMRYAKHRHRGFDVYLITQGPNLINSKIKDWVSPHRHYRLLFGWIPFCYTNEVAVNNIRNTRDIADAAVKKRVPRDERYYKTYVSASIHTDNKRFNFKILFVLFLSIIMFFFGLWYIYDYYNNQQQKNDISGPYLVPDYLLQTDPYPSMQNRNPWPAVSSHTSDKFDPVRDYAPRVLGMPETAPAYDDLRKPQDFPRPQCIYNMHTATCSCFTQQATRMQDYPRELCLSFVRDGYFDPTKPRSDFVDAASGQAI